MPAATDHIDVELKKWATPRQIEYIDALNTSGSVRAAGVLLGIDHAAIHRGIQSVRVKAAQHGYSPDHDMTRVVPDGFKVKGVSTYYDSEGQARGQWVKSAADNDRRAQILAEVCEAILEDSHGAYAPSVAPEHSDADLLTVIPMGDPHFGMLSWAEETGENFDLKIAERVTFAAVDRLCAVSPASHTAMLLNLGDFFHADNSTNRTARSQNQLDVDGRFDKIAMVGVMAMVRCIRRLLEKHQAVIVRNNRGNHDPHAASMLTIALMAWFHNEPRVTVETTPSSFYYHRFGKVLIGSTHGDGAKLADLPLIMATDVPEHWAQASFRVWHCGHFHHDQMKEHPGCSVETHRTLAAGDAWHRHEGYRAGRDLKSIIYHREFGEMTRIRCGIGQLM